MTNKEILDIYRGINQCGNLTGVEFSYAIAKNAKKLAPEVDTIQEEIKKLQLEHCERDEKGEPIIEDEKYKMKDIKKFDAEYKKLMEIESKIEIHMINKSDIPSNITAQQMTGIMDIITE